MNREVEIFHEEAQELLFELEKSCLTLEENPKEKEAVELVFRVMHTFKGNSKIFGFESIADYTHHLENIFDKVRNNELVISDEIMSATFKSIDLLSALLEDQDLSSDELKIEYEERLKEVMTICGESETVNEQSKTTNKTKKKLASYLITYKPEPDIYLTGGNPSYIIEDLLTLGKTVVATRTNGVPHINSIDPELNYIVWEILLETESTEEEIKDVFIFSSDKALIKVDELPSSFTVSGLGNGQISAFKNDTWNPLTDTQQVEKGKTKKTSTAKSQSAIKVAGEKLDELMNLVSELITTQAQLKTLCLTTGSMDLINLSENIEKIATSLRESTFNICLVGVDTLAIRFKRMIRDLASSLDKKVDFIIDTQETELDKNIIEKLTDPLMHILRNCMDHGIETKEERAKTSKSEVAKIRFSSFYKGTNVVIRIEDDGRGIDSQKIKQKAISKGLIKEDEKLSDEETYQLLFAPGFSTAENVTEISGRGVGLDVVQKNISDLRGRIEVKSKLGEGSSFDIILPLTLSIIDGLLVRSGKTKFVLPLNYVDSCHEVNKVNLVKSFNNTLIINELNTPFLDMAFYLDGKASEQEIQQLILLKNENRISLVVDEIIGKHQAVIQSMGKMYARNTLFSGGNILGDGTVALVIDCHELIDHYQQFLENNLMYN